MSDARKKAEEALAQYDSTAPEYRCADADDMADVIRALLAEQDSAGALAGALTLICDTSEANADRCIVEMKRLAHDALDAYSRPAPSPARDEVREAACAAAIRGLRLTPNEIRKAILDVAPYGPRDRCEVYVLAAAEKAAEALAALAERGGE